MSRRLSTSVHLVALLAVGFDPLDKFSIATHNLPGGLGPLLAPSAPSRQKLRLIHRIAKACEVSIFVEVHGTDYDDRVLASEFSGHYVFLDLHPERASGGILILIQRGWYGKHFHHELTFPLSIDPGRILSLSL